MKKVLLATTLLAGTAGFAAAEVAVSGSAEIGVIKSERAGGFAGSQNLQFHQDVEVKFSLSGETDGGLSFGAVIDLDETNVAAGDDSGTTVFVSGAFGKLTMGDTDGGLDWAVQDAGSLSSMGDDHTSHVAYFNANGFDGSYDNQVVRYEYSFGEFGVALSLEQAANGAPSVLDDNVGIGATYSTEFSGTKLRFGLGYQSGSNGTTNGDVWGVSVGAELAAGLSGMVGYTDISLDGAGNDRSTLGLGVTYKTGALSMSANYGLIDPEVGVDVESYGLAVNYDLGGGAVVMAGFGNDVDGVTPGAQHQYSVGLGLSF